MLTAMNDGHAYKQSLATNTSVHVYKSIQLLSDVPDLFLPLKHGVQPLAYWHTCNIEVLMLVPPVCCFCAAAI
jgi:hypothetical protein